jgi:hypothetical protein
VGRIVGGSGHAAPPFMPRWLLGRGASPGPGRAGPPRPRRPVRTPRGLGAGRGMGHAAGPSGRPHHARGPRRDRPPGRAHRRAGQALRRRHRGDHPRVAEARPEGLPRPFGPAAEAALEGRGGGARRRLRPAPRRQPRPGRPHLRGQPHPAPPEPRQRLAHPPRRRVEPRQGWSRRPPPSSGRPKTGQGRFRDHDLGFVRIGIKHLPRPRTAGGERRRRCFHLDAGQLIHIDEIQPKAR